MTLIDNLRKKLKNEKIKDLANEVTQIRKRKEQSVVKTLDEQIQAAMYWAGAYDMETGIIEVGSLEEETADTIWHEFLHKYLWEQESVEAGIMWDNIAKKIERHIGLSGASMPYVFLLPAKKAKPFKEYMKAWQYGKQKENKTPDTTFGFGITTYKSGDIKDYEKAAKEVAETLKLQLKFDTAELIENTATIGIYKGSKEPSYSPVFKGKLTDEIRKQVKAIKEKYHQESVLLYKFGGIKNIGIEISKIPENRIGELQERMSKVTFGKLGGFLSYDFAKERLTIINVPEFDSLTKEDFARFIPAIRNEVRAMGGTMKTFSLDVEVL